MQFRISISTVCFAAAGLAMVTTAGAQITEDAKLVASDAAAGDFFGGKKQFHGDQLAVAAVFDDCAAGSDCGAVYIYEKPNSGWTGQITEIAKLAASNGHSNARLGFSQALTFSGDLAVAGDRISCSGGNLCGQALVFERPIGGWSGTINESARLVPSDLAGFDTFGQAIQIGNDLIAVSAVARDCGGNNSCGAVYIFDKPVGGWSGTINESGILVASDPADVGSLGADLAMVGDLIVAGANGTNCALGSACGAVYVFEKPVGGWLGTLTESAKLIASDPGGTSQVGVTVGMSDDQSTIIAGSNRDCDTVPGRCGGVYLFTQPPGGWSGVITEAALLVANPDVTDDIMNFASISGDGETVAAGVNGQSGLPCAAGLRCGGVYVFQKPVAGWAGTVNDSLLLLASDAQADDQLGFPLIAGNTVFGGAMMADCAAGADCGAVYAWELTPPDDQGPLVTDVLANPNPLEINTPTTLTANVDDSTTGGSAIAAAEYTIDGGGAVAMNASDTTFEEVSEAVEAVIPAFVSTGVHTVCVNGSDSAGTTGDPSCIELAVETPQGAS